MSEIRTAQVVRGQFKNELVVRSLTAPEHTIYLDSADTGKVEQILSSDGAMVGEGQMLFVISNVEQRLNLLARESEVAQEAATLASMRMTVDASTAARATVLAQQESEDRQAARVLEREKELAKVGFVSKARLEDDDEVVREKRQILSDSKVNQAIAAEAERSAVEQMSAAVQNLNADLQLAKKAADSLNVRAPTAGRLTDFQLQVGQIVSQGARVGRIDDPSKVKLVALVDEYYLRLISVGQKGSVVVDAKPYSVEVSKISPQVKDGRFTVELTFDTEKHPVLPPGLNVETHLSFGVKQDALMIPVGEFLSETGGSKVYVVDTAHHIARPRDVTLGMRSSAEVEVTSGLAAGETIVESSYAAFRNAPEVYISQ